VMAVDHMRLVGNAVRWALGKVPRVSVSGPGIVDLALRENAAGLALSLHNLTNPMMLKGPVRDNFPIGAQTVAIELPQGKRGARARLVVAGKPAEVTIANGRASIAIPALDRLEVLHIEWVG
jgi:hypothetical protein